MRKVILVTGLGDHTAYIERAVRSWPEKHGIRPYVYAFGWEGNASSYSQKYKKFLAKIQEVSGDGSVALIGISAGAAAVMNAARDLPDSVSVVMSVCGRVRRTRRGLWSFRAFPVHWRCVDAVDLSTLDPAKIMTFCSILDEAVPPSQVPVDGATNIRLVVPGHVPAILWTLYQHDEQIAGCITKFS
jgi:pimeloyl-ACP methyl ester carboxylesterase